MKSRRGSHLLASVPHSTGDTHLIAIGWDCRNPRATPVRSADESLLYGTDSFVAVGENGTNRNEYATNEWTGRRLHGSRFSHLAPEVGEGIK